MQEQEEDSHEEKANEEIIVRQERPIEVEDADHEEHD